MIRVEREHRFSTTVEAGFAFITGTANWSRYWPGFVELGPGSQRSVPGDKARIVVRLLGRNVELQTTLGRFDENRLVEYESIQGGIPMRITSGTSRGLMAGSCIASWSSTNHGLARRDCLTASSPARCQPRASRNDHEPRSCAAHVSPDHGHRDSVRRRVTALVRECSRLFLESGGQGRCHRARLDRDHGDDFIVPSAGIQLMRALPSGAPAGNAGRRVPR